jgi:hypothetical protein
MFGCLRRIGCLVVLVVLAIAGWLTRDLWWERVTGRPASPAAAWTPVDPAVAPGARRRVEALGGTSGDVFATLTPAEVGALILGAGGGRLPGTVSDLEASVTGDRLSLRAQVDLRGLRSVDGLGPVARLLTARQRVTVTGRPEVAAPGRGEFRVVEVKVGGVEVPQPALGALLRQLDRGDGSSGGPGTSISFSLPRYVGDIRVARGRVILYKSTP